MTTQNIKSADQMYFTKEHDLVRKSVRDFVKKGNRSQSGRMGGNRRTPLHPLFKKMGDLGFLGIRYDPQYGGQGLDYWYELIFLEELAHIQGLGLPVAIAVQTHRATPAIYEFGSEYLKQTYLVPAIAGDMVASIAVTELGLGPMSAPWPPPPKRTETHYIINGSKNLYHQRNTGGFSHALARTSEDPGYHSYSLFVVPTNLPGFQVSKKLDKLGMRSSDTAELFFDDVRVPKENLIGREGEGFIYQMQQFQHERFSAIPGGYIVDKGYY